MFFTYAQNNSGGSFDYDVDAGIAQYVIIEADNVSDANAKALNIGLYFEGCDSGIDCSCCGDRWYEPWGEDSGTQYPSIYDYNATNEREYRDGIMRDGISKSWTRKGNFTTFVHYADGTFKGFGKA